MNPYALGLAAIIAQASSCSPNMSPAQPDSGAVAQTAPASVAPSATPSPETSGPLVSPSPQESAQASPAGSASPSASSTPSASPVASPSASPLYKFRYTPKPAASPDPNAAQILEIDLNDDHLQPHGKIQMRVLTSPNVVKVQTQSNGQVGTLVQDGPGEFSATGSLPGIPFIARGWKINLEFIATTADGHKTSVKVPVTLG